ncbi:hypothetical protein KEM60_02072 [Austwickia sp. TVS 96-490-7B]|nr:hypothetical protein [Austwickia sp. TVS 96-490-7B]
MKVFWAVLSYQLCLVEISWEALCLRQQLPGVKMGGFFVDAGFVVKAVTEAEVGVLVEDPRHPSAMDFLPLGSLMEIRPQ